MIYIIKLIFLHFLVIFNACITVKIPSGLSQLWKWISARTETSSLSLKAHPNKQWHGIIPSWARPGRGDQVLSEVVGVADQGHKGLSTPPPPPPPFISPYAKVGALGWGGGSWFYMSILRKPTVALSNLRNAHVALSNLRYVHDPCHCMSMTHVTIILILMSHVTKA